MSNKMIRDLVSYLSKYSDTISANIMVAQNNNKVILGLAEIDENAVNPRYYSDSQEIDNAGTLFVIRKDDSDYLGNPTKDHYLPADFNGDKDDILKQINLSKEDGSVLRIASMDGKLSFNEQDGETFGFMLLDKSKLSLEDKMSADEEYRLTLEAELNDYNAWLNNEVYRAVVLEWDYDEKDGTFDYEDHHYGFSGFYGKENIASCYDDMKSVFNDIVDGGEWKIQEINRFEVEQEKTKHNMKP